MREGRQSFTTSELLKKKKVKMKGLFNFEGSISTGDKKSQIFSMGKHASSENNWLGIKL